MRNIIAGVVAGFLLLLFLFALGTGWIWAVVAAVAGYAGVLLVLMQTSTRESVQYPAGISAESARQVTGQARATIARIRNKAAAIGEQRVRQKTLALCDTADRIVDELQRDPKDISQARQFLSYYLDAEERVVTRYAELSVRAGSSPDIRKTLDKVEPTLDVMSGAFSRQLDSLLHDDVLDLDAELSLLQKSVKLDGLLGDIPTAPELAAGEPGDGTATPAEAAAEPAVDHPAAPSSTTSTQ